VENSLACFFVFSRDIFELILLVFSGVIIFHSDLEVTNKPLVAADPGEKSSSIPSDDVGMACSSSSSGVEEDIDG